MEDLEATVEYNMLLACARDNIASIACDLQDHGEFVLAVVVFTTRAQLNDIVGLRCTQFLLDTLPCETDTAKVAVSALLRAKMAEMTAMTGENYGA